MIFLGMIKTFVWASNRYCSVVVFMKVSIAIADDKICLTNPLRHFLLAQNPLLLERNCPAIPACATWLQGRRTSTVPSLFPTCTARCSSTFCAILHCHEPRWYCHSQLKRGHECRSYVDFIRYRHVVCSPSQPAMSCYDGTRTRGQYPMKQCWCESTRSLVLFGVSVFVRVCRSAPFAYCSLRTTIANSTYLQHRPIIITYCKHCREYVKHELSKSKRV